VPTDRSDPPIWQQYQSLKAAHPDALLLFRMGDFYETFDADAEIVARELEIVLTSREMGRGRRHPLAGIPYHALESYLGRLVAAGHRVAICDQITEPGVGRGLVERAVVRVVTPGTLIEPGLLDARTSAHLGAIALNGDRWALAMVDASTGSFRVCEIEAVPRRRDDPDEPPTVLLREIERWAPSELLLPSEDPRAGVPPWASRLDGGPTLTPYPAWRFDDAEASGALRRQFGVVTLEPFGLTDSGAARGACGALVAYLGQTAASALPSLRPPGRYALDSFMILDSATRRGLELTQAGRGNSSRGTLLELIDRARTAPGARLTRAWLSAPLRDIAPIAERQNTIAALRSDPVARTRLGALLHGIPDLERIAARIVAGRALPRELRAFRAGLARAAHVRGVIAPMAALDAGRLPTLATEMVDLSPIESLIDGAILEEPAPQARDSGVIRPDFSPELRDLLATTADARHWIADLEPRERARTGIRTLKVGFNRVFGYYVEISAAALRNPPPPEMGETSGHSAGATVEDLLASEFGYVRKQTLIGAERFTLPDLKVYERQVMEASEAQGALEERLFGDLLRQIAERIAGINSTIAALAELDVLVGWADLAVEFNYVRPLVHDRDRAIEIVGGRHPTLERRADASAFVPNDCRLDGENEQIIVITGPNMAGKSTFLRQVGLIVILAQIGAYVPAESATIGVVDRVFTRVGAQDEIYSGQSTFMVEMAETAAILHQATPHSLVILDEIGRGTSTFDGMAIARAIVEHLHDDPRLGCRTLLATHYHELTALAETLTRVRNARVEVVEKGDSVTFLHRVIPGGTDRSYGVHVAQIAGLPRSIVLRSRKILRELERGRSRQREAAPAADFGATLFTPPVDPLVDHLAGLSVENLTPLQALQTLYEVVERARERQRNG